MNIKLKKMFIIVCLILFVLLVSVASVSANNLVDDNQALSASDTNTAVSASVVSNPDFNMNVKNSGGSGNDLLESASGEILRDSGDYGSYANLSESIKLAKDSIKLSQNYKFDSSSDNIGGVVISKDNFVLDGGGYTIDGNNAARAFQVTGNNVTLKNLNIINTYGLSSSTVNDGISIYWLGNDGYMENVYIKDSISSGICRGSVSWEGSNGMINQSTFENCKVGQNAGVHIKGECKIYNSIFKNCTQYSQWGAAMGLTSTAKAGVLVNCTFDHCQPTASNSGIVFTQRNSFELIKDCRFINCTSSWYLIGVCNEIHLVNCTFEDNNVKNFFSTALLEVINTTVKNTKLTNSINVALLTVENSTFDNIDIGGNLFYLNTGSYPNFISSTFSNLHGPIVTTNVVGVKFDGCNLTNITTTSVAPIVLNGNYATVVNCTFTNTTGNTYGAVYVEPNANLQAIIKDNIYNTGSALPDIPEGIDEFDLLEICYVSPTGSGCGTSLDDCCSLDYALTHTLNYGTVYLRNGTYTLNNQKTVNFNVIGYEDGVIVDNGVFSLNSMFTKVENILFNNTKYSVYMERGCTLNNCTFTNADVANLFTLYNSRVVYGYTLSNLIFKDCDLKGGDLIVVSEHSKTYNITITDCTGINRLFRNHCDVMSDVYIDTITVEKSDFNDFITYAYDGNGGAATQYGSQTYTNIHIINNTISKGYLIYNNRYSGVSKIAEWTVTANTFTPTANLFNYYSGLTLSALHINDITATSCYIVSSSLPVKLSDSSFDNVNVGSIISGSSSHSLVNVEITDSNLNTLVTNANNLDGLTVRNTVFSSDNVCILQRDAVVVNSVFDNVTGHIIVNGPNVEFEKSSWNDCNNPSLNGSCVEVVGGNYISFTGCNFTSNTADCGGAVYMVQATLRPSFFDCNFTDNFAISAGGALYFAYVAGDGTVVNYGGITNETLNLTDVAPFCYNSVYGNITNAATIVYVVNDTTTWTYSSTHDARSWNTAGTFETAYAIAGKDCVFVFVRSGDIFNYTNTNLEGALMSTLDEGWILMGNNTEFVNIRFHIATRKGDFRLYNITMTGNTYGSTIIVDEENVLFEDCKFIGNGGEKVSYGNIQINNDNVNFTRCIMGDNIAGNTSDAFGGAIYINGSSITIQNCTFYSNAAYTTGAHIYLKENNHDILINNTVFRDAQPYGSGLGNGVVIQGANLVVNNCTFETNTVKNNGVLSVVGNVNYLSINDCVFNNNHGTVSGNGVALSLDFTNSLNTPILVSGCNFTNNDGASLISGAGLYVTVAGVSVSDCQFGDNHGVNGAGLYIDAKDVSLVNCEFTNNTATQFGGAIYVADNANIAEISECNFINNTAYLNGGAIYSPDNAGNCRITLSNFVDNKVNEYYYGYGGAIRLGSCSVENCNFTGNIASYTGGAIWCNNLSVENCNFTNNSAKYGGAIRANVESNVTNCNFTTNNALQGGAIWMSSGRVEKCNFIKNHASTYGGAICIKGNNINVTKCEFIKNEAPDGSAIYVGTGFNNLTVRDCTFTENNATTHGTVYIVGVDSLSLGGRFESNYPNDDVDNFYYITPSAKYTLSVVYVREGATGTGVNPDDPASLTQTFWNEHIESTAKIIFLSDYDININTLEKKNITIVGNGYTLRRSGAGKYLFILPIIQKYIKKKQIVF